MLPFSVSKHTFPRLCRVTASRWSLPRSINTFHPLLLLPCSLKTVPTIYQSRFSSTISMFPHCQRLTNPVYRMLKTLFLLVGLFSAHFCVAAPREPNKQLVERDPTPVKCAGYSGACTFSIPLCVIPCAIGAATGPVDIVICGVSSC